MPNTQTLTVGKLKGRFVASWWEDGRRRRYRLEAQSRASAETEAIAVYQRERLRAENHTVGALWQMYCDEKQGRRVATTMRYEWRVMEQYFGHLKPEELTVHVCRKYTAARRKMKPKGKATAINDGTIWTELGHLRTVMTWAHKRRLIPFAPVIERPQKPAPKDRWLTREECTRLIDAAQEHHVKLAIMLMLATAGRVGAILELTWDRVDFERGYINLRTTETGPRKGRAAVPMNDGIRSELLIAKQAALSNYVIEWSGKPIKRLRTGFNAAVKAAGLKHVTPHVLRHTAAVHLAAAGVSMERISQYLGHSSTSVTERVYARFAPEHLRQEAEILDFTKPLEAQT
jgi:integrase